MPLLGLKYFEGALRWRIKGILLRYVHNVAVRIGALCFGLEARKVYVFDTVIFIYEPVKILVRNQKLGVELFTILFCYFTWHIQHSPQQTFLFTQLQSLNFKFQLCTEHLWS